MTTQDIARLPDQRVFTDSMALDMIAAHLTGREWDASDIERVAEIVQLAGRVIAEPDDDTCDTCGGISPTLALDDPDLIDAGGPCPECDTRCSDLAAFVDAFNLGGSVVLVDVDVPMAFSRDAIYAETRGELWLVRPIDYVGAS